MNDVMIRLILLSHAAATLYMVGLIWFVQVVHYPLMGAIGDSEFSAYEQRHMSLTTWVVAPPMLIEAATALLLFWFRPTGVSIWFVWVGVILLAITWLSTAFLGRDLRRNKFVTQPTAQCKKPVPEFFRPFIDAIVHGPQAFPPRIVAVVDPAQAQRISARGQFGFGFTAHLMAPSLGLGRSSHRQRIAYRFPADRRPRECYACQTCRM